MRWTRGILLPLAILAGCTRMRTTNPPQTATEQFLHSVAAGMAAEKTPAEALAGQEVFVDSTFVTAKDGPTPAQRFMVAEFRAHVLQAGGRLVNDRARARIIVELLSGGLGVDRYDLLLGIPIAPLVSAAGGYVSPDVQTALPDVAIVRDLRQYGFADLGFVAYWNGTGEVIAQSDPAVGRSHQENFRFIAARARTASNLPTTRPEEP